MPPAAVAVPNLLVDPGWLFWAPIGTAIPTHTAAASKFSDAWAAAWLPLGATAEGSTFQYEVEVEAMSVAELFDPIKYATVARSGNLSFALADWTLTNLKRALNGGTITTTGTGATSVNALDLPAPGAEVRAMLGWESADSTVRMVIYQALSSGTIESVFQKAPDFAQIPCTFNFEMPPGGTQPFKPWTAGAARA
jgi:hypothetical protein